MSDAKDREKIYENVQRSKQSKENHDSYWRRGVKTSINPNICRTHPQTVFVIFFSHFIIHKLRIVMVIAWIFKSLSLYRNEKLIFKIAECFQLLLVSDLIFFLFSFVDGSNKCVLSTENNLMVLTRVYIFEWYEPYCFISLSSDWGKAKKKTKGRTKLKVSVCRLWNDPPGTWCMKFILWTSMKFSHPK